MQRAVQCLGVSHRHCSAVFVTCECVVENAWNILTTVNRSAVKELIIECKKVMNLREIVVIACELSNQEWEPSSHVWVLSPGLCTSEVCHSNVISLPHYIRPPSTNPVPVS